MSCPRSGTEAPSHVTTVIRASGRASLDSRYCLQSSDVEFISLTDPRLACKEFVYYRPVGEKLSQHSLYVNCCGERTVYKISFPEGGCINTRVFNKI
ncbi:E4 ORF 6/7 [Bat mastadenovirus G]|uniref:E4 ORF 6/7 n=1 Tax=Bat mastadenovirus G TaxID=2015376 RepID=A0A1J0FAR4_9ADEN|nr:E4 ORF 6/7 [Bat mastadenovirus G]APC26078.1 E4 ORF 6/7 [Bat mastadenovirus G]